MPSGQFRSGAPVAHTRAATPGTTHIHAGKPALHPHKQFHHQGHKHHRHHGHGHGFVTTGIVFPGYYPFYPYYPYYPSYPAPYYGPPAPPPGVLYYCAAYGAYYPYVSECPSGWQMVQPGNY